MVRAFVMDVDAMWDGCYGQGRIRW